MQKNTISNYVFKDSKLFEWALTHSSYSNEPSGRNKSANNERLEFLGDAVVELVASEFIFKSYPELSEGEMTKLRANVVCEASLADAAKTLGLGHLMRMGKGEERTGGRDRGSILADCFEAVAGAVFLDGGFLSAKNYILESLSGIIKQNRISFQNSDYKTRLQEELQKFSKEPIEYTVIDEFGPAHDKTFFVELVHAGKVLAKGHGKSKKEAEQNCAKYALNSLNK